jgi:hypothetical protein
MARIAQGAGADFGLAPDQQIHPLDPRLDPSTPDSYYASARRLARRINQTTRDSQEDSDEMARKRQQNQPAEAPRWGGLSSPTWSLGQGALDKIARPQPARLQPARGRGAPTTADAVVKRYDARSGPQSNIRRLREQVKEAKKRVGGR